MRHIVLFAFKESVPPAERAAVLDAIRGLPAKVPSIRSFELGESITPDQGYTHVSLVTFDDRAELAAYLSHPDHAPVGARMRAAASQVLVVDLEV